MVKPITYLEALSLVEHFPTNNTFHFRYPALREFIQAQQAKIEALEAQLAKPPKIAAKIGGQAFQIPPHDQAPVTYPAVNEDWILPHDQAVTLSLEAQAVEEILAEENEDDL